jgi:hypothetical protein
VRRGHESCELFVRHLHDVESFLSVALRDAPERTHDAVDAVAGIGEDAADVPRLEALEQMIGDGVGQPPSLGIFESCALPGGQLVNW